MYVTLLKCIPTLFNELTVILSVMYIRMVTVNLRYITPGCTINMRRDMRYYGDI